MFEELNKQFEILEKSLDTSKLVKKQVQIHLSSGKTVTGYRWVSQDTGKPVITGKDSIENDIFRQKKLVSKPEDASKEKTPDDENISKRLIEIAEGGGTKSKRIRDMVGLGVYDMSLIMQMNPDVNVSNVTAYLKEAGVDHKKIEGGILANINTGLGNKQAPISQDEVKNMSVEKLREITKDKDFDKILKQKKEERAAKYGIVVDDKWNAYDFKLDQLIKDRIIRSLIAYGTGGIGKTFTLLEKLKENNKVAWDPELDLEPAEYDYVKITGNTSPTDLYNLMYQNSKKILIFDDCDSMWDDENMANMLKGALDSSGDRMISYANPKKLPDGTLPTQRFKFNGQIMFISNLPRKAFPQPLVDSRSSAIDLTMTMDQTLDKLDQIRDKVKFETVDGDEIKISTAGRKEIVDLLRELKDDLRVEQVNGRTLGMLAGIKSKLDSSGKSDHKEFVKQSLIALDLV